MGSARLLALSLAVLAGCAKSSKAVPGGPTEPPLDPDQRLLVQTWIIQNHVLSEIAPTTDQDAMLFHGRKVEISRAGYHSPFTGECREYVREKRRRVLADLFAQMHVPESGRHLALRFGIGNEPTEYRLICRDRPPVPLVTLYLSDDRAMSCHNGVCYLMAWK
jgi:hypothetical protein